MNANARKVREVQERRRSGGHGKHEHRATKRDRSRADRDRNAINDQTRNR